MKQKIKTLLQQGQFKKAEKLCRTLLKGSGKTDSEVWTLAANIYTRLGDFPKVQKSCAHAIKIAPKNFEAQFLLAMAEHSLGNIPPAISGYRKTIEILPSHTGAHANLGMVLPTWANTKMPHPTLRPPSNHTLMTRDCFTVLVMFIPTLAIM
jgi:Flp pilus assembly protein TadD